MGSYLSACGAETTPPIVSPAPTSTPRIDTSPLPFTPTPEPLESLALQPTEALTATQTPPIPTLARRRDLTATPGPSPTSPLFPTHTPEPATLTATAQPTLAGLFIRFFTAASEELAPGQNVTLFWEVGGAERVSIFELNTEGEREREWRNLSTSGQLTVNPTVIPAADESGTGSARFTLVASTGETSVEQILDLAFNCTTVWFFAPPPASCPSTPPAPTFQVEQRFERGFMIWLEVTREIYIVYNDGQTPAWLLVPDTFVEGDPERDDNIIPPAGLLQPIRGFGKIWRENQRTRERLGWALQPEFGYDGLTQSSGTTDATRATYLRAAEGDILELLAGGQSWQFIAPDATSVQTSTPTATATIQNGSP